MRGRKDKYYEQVDDEDLSFAEDTERGLLLRNGRDAVDSALSTKRGEEEELDKIVEEGSGDEGVIGGNEKDNNSNDNLKANETLLDS